MRQKESEKAKDKETMTGEDYVKEKKEKKLRRAADEVTATR